MTFLARHLPFRPYKIGIIILIVISVLIGILYTNKNDFQASVSCGASKVYWIDGVTMKRANLADGTNTESLVTGMDGGDGIALDISNNKMYWTNGGSNIYRVDIDGDTGDIETIVTGASTTESITLDTVLTNKMYWTDEDEIWEADLDGSNSVALMTLLAQPMEIATDGNNDQMFWVNT